MLRQCPRAVYDVDGMLLRGVVVRHLVLPGGRKDSIEVLNRLVERFGSESFLLSLMSQYTPSFAKETPYRELHREVTTFEYQSVADVAVRLGLQGFFQSKDSATADYTPDFSEETL